MSFTSKLVSVSAALVLGLAMLPSDASAMQDGWYHGKKLVSEQPLPSARQGDSNAIWLCPVRDGKPATSQYSCGWFQDPDKEALANQSVSMMGQPSSMTCTDQNLIHEHTRYGEIVWYPKTANGCWPRDPTYHLVGDCTESYCPYGQTGYYAPGYGAQPAARPSASNVVWGLGGLVLGAAIANSGNHHHYCDRWGCY